MSEKRQVWGEYSCDVKTRTANSAMLVVAFIFFVDRCTMSDKTDSNEVVVVPESIISSLEQVQRRATCTQIQSICKSF